MISLKNFSLTWIYLISDMLGSVERSKSSCFLRQGHQFLLSDGEPRYTVDFSQIILSNSLYLQLQIFVRLYVCKINKPIKYNHQSGVEWIKIATESIGTALFCLFT